MATKTLGKDPTANQFALLFNDPNTKPAAKPKKVTAPAAAASQADAKTKPATGANPVNNTNPPGAAKAPKKKKEGDDKKAANPNAPANNANPQNVADDTKGSAPKLSREQWEIQKKNAKKQKDVNPPVLAESTSSDLNVQQAFDNIPSDGFVPAKQGNTGGRFQGQGERGRGNRGDRGRFGPRGGRGGGRGRGGEGRSPRLDENRNRDTNFRGQNISGDRPYRGREFDKHSGMKTTRQPNSKRQGGGQYNYGGPKEEFPIINETSWEPENQAAPADVADSKWEEIAPAQPAPLAGEQGWEETNQATSESHEATVAVVAKPPETPQKSYTQFMKEQEEKKVALQALLGNKSVAPRTVVADQTEAGRYVEPEKVSEKKKDEIKVKKPKTKEVKEKKVPKTLAIDEVFTLKAAPQRRGRGRRFGADDDFEEYFNYDLNKESAADGSGPVVEETGGNEGEGQQRPPGEFNRNSRGRRGGRGRGQNRGQGRGRGQKNYQGNQGGRFQGNQGVDFGSSGGYGGNQNTGGNNQNTGGNIQNTGGNNQNTGGNNQNTGGSNQNFGNRGNGGEEQALSRDTLWPELG